MQPFDHAQGKPTGQHLEQLQNALLDACNLSDLKLLARTGFDVDLARIVPTGAAIRPRSPAIWCAGRPRRRVGW